MQRKNETGYIDDEGRTHLPLEGFNDRLAECRRQHHATTGEWLNPKDADMAFAWSGDTPCVRLTFDNGASWLVEFGPTATAIMESWTAPKH